MKNLQKHWNAAVRVGICTSLLSLSVAQAGELSLLDARLEGVYATNSVGNSSSGVLSWLPSYQVMDKLAVKGNFGVSAYAGTNDDTITIINTGALVSYDVMDILSVELGGGAQTWLDNSTYGMGTLNVAWKPASPIFGRINKVVAGYSYVATDEPTSEIRVGVEFNFGTVIGGASPEAAPAASAAK